MTMPNTAYLPQIGRGIVVQEGETILQAALAAGISYPHGCRMGRCGACKSHLVSGEVELLKHTPFSLTEEEKAERLTLACRAMPKSDVTISWLDGADEIADIAAGRFEGLIAETVEATHDIKLVRVKIGNRNQFDFRAGQYVRFFYPAARPAITPSPAVPTRNWSNSTSDMSRVAQPAPASLSRRRPEIPSHSKVRSAHPSCAKNIGGPFSALLAAQAWHQSRRLPRRHLPETWGKRFTSILVRGQLVTYIWWSNFAN